MLLNVLSISTLDRVDRALLRSCAIVRAVTTGIRLRILAETHHRACERELTSRGYGRIDPMKLGI